MTRHLLKQSSGNPSTDKRRTAASSSPLGYSYMAFGPHSSGFQPAYTELRPTSPTDYPWNRLDQVGLMISARLDL